VKKSWFSSDGASKQAADPAAKAYVNHSYSTRFKCEYSWSSDNVVSFFQIKIHPVLRLASNLFNHNSDKKKTAAMIMETVSKGCVPMICLFWSLIEQNWHMYSESCVSINTGHLFFLFSFQPWGRWALALFQNHRGRWLGSQSIASPPWQSKKLSFILLVHV
jgi:hypothetical protein